jgi:phospholipid/cholesterol/gamma-HCH transport system permease protein
MAVRIGLTFRHKGDGMAFSAMNVSHWIPSRVVLSILEFARQALSMVFWALRPSVFRRSAVRMVLSKQIYFTGIQAVLPISLAALAIGLTFETQMRSVLGSGVEINVKMNKLVVLGELAPLLAGVIVLGRSGAAMATELASMKVRGEIRSLYLMGIDPGEYLVAPRLLGAAISVPALTLVFQLVAAGLSPVLASFFTDVPLLAHYAALRNTLELHEIILVFLKSAVFGLMIASTACASGIFVPPERTWVPQAAELAVMRGLAGLLGTDIIFAIIHAALP